MLLLALMLLYSLIYRIYPLAFLNFIVIERIGYIRFSDVRYEDDCFLKFSLSFHAFQLAENWGDVESDFLRTYKQCPTIELADRILSYYSTMLTFYCFLFGIKRGNLFQG